MPAAYAGTPRELLYRAFREDDLRALACRPALGSFSGS